MSDNYSSKVFWKLLRYPGPPLIWEGGPACFSRFYWLLLKYPGPHLIWKGGPDCFSRFYWLLLKYPCPPLIWELGPDCFSRHYWQSFFLKTTFPLGRTSQKFKPNPNEIFLRSKNILAWVRFKFLGNQAFNRGCGGLPPLGSANRIWLG